MSRATGADPVGGYSETEATEDPGLPNEDKDLHQMATGGRIGKVAVVGRGQEDILETIETRPDRHRLGIGCE